MKQGVMKLCRRSALVMGLFLPIVLSASEKNHSEKNWEELCHRTKPRLTAEHQTVVFSEKPDIKIPSNYWLLKWEGLDIPIPSIRYSDIFITQDEHGYFELVLVSLDDEVFISTSTSNNKLYDFGSEKITSEMSDEVISGAKRMSRLSNLMMMAFSITPDDLTCKNQNKVVEAEQAIALILKGVYHSKKLGTLVSVYRNVGQYEGWLDKKKNDKRAIYSANILLSPSSDLISQVSYGIPERQAFSTLPYLLGNSELLSQKAYPEWLDALNIALKNNTKRDWKKYIVSAQDAYFSEKSIDTAWEILHKK